MGKKNREIHKVDLIFDILKENAIKDIKSFVKLLKCYEAVNKKMFYTKDILNDKGEEVK